MPFLVGSETRGFNATISITQRFRRRFKLLIVFSFSVGNSTARTGGSNSPTGNAGRGGKHDCLTSSSGAMIEVAVRPRRFPDSRPFVPTGATCFPDLIPGWLAHTALSWGMPLRCSKSSHLPRAVRSSSLKSPSESENVMRRLLNPLLFQ
jgi:hypothetical protein